jgi:hypothetical protein
VSSADEVGGSVDRSVVHDDHGGSLRQGGETLKGTVQLEPAVSGDDDNRQVR